jgi:prevent-host-death family protein
MSQSTYLQNVTTDRMLSPLCIGSNADLLECNIMTRQARVVVLNCPHHIMRRGNKRERIFFEEGDCQVYLDLMAEQLALFDIGCWSHRLMPNRLHFILVPTQASTFDSTVVEVAVTAHGAKRILIPVLQNSFRIDILLKINILVVKPKSGSRMTLTITASQANQEFSKLLRQVQQGEDFVVMSRGRAVARVIPYAEEKPKNAMSAMLEKLEQLPRRTLSDWSRDDLYS